MRLLLASDHFPPFIGGAHRQARLLAGAMAERGNSVAVATPWHGGLPRLEEIDGFTVHRIRQLRTALPFLVRSPRQRHQPPFPDPVTVLGLRRLISEFEPDLIHAYGWLAFSVAVAMGRRRIPLLVSARDYGYFCATRTLLRKGEPCSGPAPVKCLVCASDYYGPGKGVLSAAGVALSRPLLERRMTGLHSVSTYVRDVTKRYLDPRRGEPDWAPDPVEVVIPSFQEQASETETNRSDPPGLERLPDRPFILFVGAFRRVKGLEVLFEAYRRLDSPPPLVLMGTFERDSPEQFPPEATVITDAPHDAVMAAWDRAMFGVMPSLWPEPLGATVAEGMSRGKPVIGTSLGGHADMIDETTGILVPQGDVEALATAMAELAAYPQRRESLGVAAQRRAREFSQSVVVPRFEATYDGVIAAGTCRRPA